MALDKYVDIWSATTEAQLEKATKKALKDLGCIVEKYKTPSKRGAPDDIIICRFGAVLFAEFKNPFGTGALSPLQKVTISNMRRNCAEVWVITGADDAIRLIERCRDA